MARKIKWSKRIKNFGKVSHALRWLNKRGYGHRAKHFGRKAYSTVRIRGHGLYFPLNADNKQLRAAEAYFLKRTINEPMPRNFSQYLYARAHRVSSKRVSIT